MFDVCEPQLVQTSAPSGVIVATPHLPDGMSPADAEHAQRAMIDQLVAQHGSTAPVLWYYTPMPVSFTEHVAAQAVVYDCMDELSLFAGAPAALCERERQLLSRADVVFTGGHSLYEHKRTTCSHPNMHAFPSSVDVAHFARARAPLADPADQIGIRHPRVGFFGVIDERLDRALLDELAASRPDLQLVMLGPIAKICPASLPRRPNLWWLGAKRYDELPAYLAGWDVAFLPFARNDATRFISPTKTPEYLAAGRPIVSTSIRDVVTPYGERGLAWIADTAHDSARAIDAALASDPAERVRRADAFLANLSWDHTWAAMWSHVERVLTPGSAECLTI